MAKLTYKDVDELKLSDIRDMSGTIRFSSTVTMALFMKKLNCLSRSYKTDYTQFVITFN